MLLRKARHIALLAFAALTVVGPSALIATGAASADTAAPATATASTSTSTSTPVATASSNATASATTSVPAYWLASANGGVFSFGGAPFYGSAGNLILQKPIVGMAATPDDAGYWLVASDGGVFSFGDANFFGSTGAITLNKPIIGMIAGPKGSGYVLVASDGGTFTFGSAPFFGSLGGVPLNAPITAAATTPGDTGYWFSDIKGVVSAFGQASYYGSAPAQIGSPIVGMVRATGNGTFVGAAYPSGSFGYDVSKFNMNSPTCTTGLPPGDHTISIVEVDGSAGSFANPCLGAEARWAGAGLNLYTFLANVGLCSTGPTCFQQGEAAGIQAFHDAQAAGVNTNVAWWLDVEGAGQYWTTSTANNAQTVAGAIAALHNTEGIADVGIYASPGTWNSIVGNYQPAVPYWMANWLTPPSGPGTCATVPTWQAKEQLPTGPVQIVQYGNNVNGADGDYAC
jgi:hypothetical protein